MKLASGLWFVLSSCVKKARITKRRAFFMLYYTQKFWCMHLAQFLALSVVAESIENILSWVIDIVLCIIY